MNSKNKLVVYFPSQFQTEVIEIMHLLSDAFQGCTSYEVKGTWKNTKGEYIDEHITLIYSYYEDISKKDLEGITDTLRQYKTACKQESVMIELREEVIFL